MFAKNRKIRKVSDFSKASCKRDIGLISFSETQYQKQRKRGNRLELQTVVVNSRFIRIVPNVKCMGMRYYVD